jgi:predicted glycosyltransferase
MMVSPREKPTAKRIVVYCQHLSGAGHYVRSREIVRALARQHDVWFVVGGSPVPGPPLDVKVHLVQLPAIYRTPTGLAPLDSTRSLEEVFADRTTVFCRLLREVCPDVLLIEHFPFSKWVLRREILAAIDAARSANRQLRVLCSVRDYPAGHEVAASAEQFRNEVVPTLNENFDALLVHADPRVVRLESLFPWVREICIRIHYTGYVAEKLPEETPRHADRSEKPTAGQVIVSSGGLRDGFRLANLCVAAWKQLDERRVLGGRSMVIFAGLYAEEGEYAALEQSVSGGPFELRRFSDSFLRYMKVADLSISQGGYNTTVNVLETRARAILAPNGRTYDQVRRARRLAEWGLVDCSDPATETPEDLAVKIDSVLSRPRPTHSIALDGAEQTRAVIESH